MLDEHFAKSFPPAFHENAAYLNRSNNETMKMQVMDYNSIRKVFKRFQKSIKVAFNYKVPQKEFQDLDRLIIQAETLSKMRKNDQMSES